MPHHNKWLQEPEPIFEFSGQKFYLEEDVIYSVYPLVERGTGFITKEGVRSTGQTRIDIEEQGFGDICPFEGLYDITKFIDLTEDQMAELCGAVFEIMDAHEIREHVTERLLEYYTDEEPIRLYDLYQKHVANKKEN